MAALTLGASAALRVVLDAGRQSAVIERLAAADAVYAPSLFVAETANALWKYVGAGHVTVEGALRLHRDATALVDRYLDDAELFPETLTVASHLRHPVYDALYLVTARRTGSALLTFDKKLAALAQKLDIALAE
ncbi:MAG: type II toxin-antitoxin system VapC family toxin [Lysobacterales bacterium]